MFHGDGGNGELADGAWLQWAVSVELSISFTGC